MPTDVSVAMSLKDNMSAALLDMRNSMARWRTDMGDLQAELDTLSNKKVSLKMDMTQARQEANLARKSVAELGAEGDEATRAAAKADWTQAEDNLERLRQRYDSVSRQVRQTQKEIDDLWNTGSKLENRAEVDGLLSSLATAGITSLAGDVGAQFLGAVASSSYGSEVGSLLDSALSGAAVGAGLGSLGGPVMAAIGAGLGGAVGTF